MKRLDLLSMLCILIGLLPFVVGRTPRDTNASRFARGLPPVRPDRLYNATRTGPSLARRSGLPSTFLLGVYMDAQTAPYCYVGAYAGDPAVSCVSAEDALLFTSSQPEGSSIPASLTVVSPGSSNGKLLTAEADTPDQGSDTTYPVTVFTTENVQSLGPNAQPGSAPSLSGWSVDPVYYETDVYYISSDGTLSVVWTDPTGSADPTTPLILWLWDGDYEVPTYIYGSYDLAATRRAGWEPIRVTIKAM